MPEKAVLPQTYLIRFARNVSIQRPLTLEIGSFSSLGSSFEIEIPTHARRIGLERIC